MLLSKKLFDLGFKLLEHHYLPDLAPPNYHDIPQLKKINLEGRTFSFNEEMIQAVETWFAEQDTFFFERPRGVAVRYDNCIN